MTTREFYVAVANFGGMSEELVEKANELIEGLDHKNALRKNKPSKDSLAAAERKNAILGFLKENEGEFFLRGDIASALDFSEGQVTSACTALVKEDAISKKEVKVDKAKKIAYGFSEN